MTPVKKRKTFIEQLQCARYCWVLILFIYLVYFCLFTAALAAYGGPQARGRIGATAAGRHHSHSSARSELHL